MLRALAYPQLHVGVFPRERLAAHDRTRDVSRTVVDQDSDVCVRQDLCMRM